VILPSAFTRNLPVPPVEEVDEELLVETLETLDLLEETEELDLLVETLEETLDLLLEEVVTELEEFPQAFTTP